MIRKSLYVFLICTLISIISWSMIKLSKFYERSESFQIVWTNIPSNYILKSENYAEISITYKAQGFIILSSQANNKKNIVEFDLGKISQQRKKANGNIIIPSTILIDRLGNKMLSGSEIISFSPDTLFVPYDELMHKRVPINIDFRLNSHEVILKSIYKASHDSVLISGSKSAIDTISQIKTQIDINRIKQASLITTKLHNPLPKVINIHNTHIDLKLEDENNIEFTTNISLPTHMEKNINYSPTKPHITARFIIPISYLENINMDSLRSCFYFENINSLDNVEVKAKQESEIKVVHIEPNSVSFSKSLSK